MKHLFAAALFLTVLIPGTLAAAGPPHIVMFLSDDHGIDFVGCYGNAAIQTPNIDALAAQGCLFTQMYAATPTCVPSRSVLYTGLYPARNGAMGNHTQTRPDVRSIPHHLRPLGYRVVLANKIHVQPAPAFPFEILKATLPANPDQPRRYREEGLDVAQVDQLLQEHQREHPDQPLCLILADNSPHVTWEKNRTYDPETLPLPPYVVDTPITRRAMANYWQDITTMDERVGRVVASLDRHGYADDTLLIYTTDQGAEWPRCKWTVYDTGIHVPFIIRWPGHIEPGTTNDALLSFVDMTPTLIDIAGGNPAAGLDGVSFLPILRGEQHRLHEVVFASHTRDGDMNVFPQRGVTDGRYKFVLNLLPENRFTTHFTMVPGIKESHYEVWKTWVEKAETDPETAHLVDLIVNHPAEEFYDTREDRYEMKNLIDDPAHAERIADMRSRLKDWMRDQQDPGLADPASSR
ncbi:MAG: sulfatase [Rhodococcus sp.]|nr:sulfatase [Rhodococcus sp. (in: high G+C Gram-positive bacteria)]